MRRAERRSLIDAFAGWKPRFANRGEQGGRVGFVAAGTMESCRNQGGKTPPHQKGRRRDQNTCDQIDYHGLSPLRWSANRRRRRGACRRSW